MTNFVDHAQRSGLKSFHYICRCTFVELWRVKSPLTELQIYNAACYDLYQGNSLFTCTLTRCNLCTASRFIRSGVASMGSHSSMPDKTNRNMKMTTELEVYLSRSFVSWDVDRCRNSAYHAMTFKKKMWFSISGSDSSQYHLQWRRGKSWAMIAVPHCQVQSGPMQRPNRLIVCIPIHSILDDFQSPPRCE